MQADEVDGSRVVQYVLRGVLTDPCSLPNWPARQIDLALRLLRRSRLLGRVAWQLRQAGLLDALPPAAADQLASALVVVESRADAARWELDRIAWALEDMPDVQIVALKGCGYLLAGTPNARGRAFADVDLLIPEASLTAVEARLRECGWVGKDLPAYDDGYYRQWAHELPPMTHAEREIEVDLHHGLVMRTSRLQPPAEPLLASARAVTGSRYHVLSPVDMVLHAMTHLFFSGELEDGLRELQDIHDLIGHFGNSEPQFWDEFWPRASALDLVRPAFYALRYAHDLLGTSVPAPALSTFPDHAPSWVSRRIMDLLVPSALYPQHPDEPTRASRQARLLLYVRSHWVRMPPTMLARHLGFKLYTRIRGALGRAHVT